MDMEEIKVFYEQYASSAFRRALCLLKNEEEAWEAVQDVFIKIMKAGSDFRRESSAWTWIYRITTNHCLNIIRRRNKWQNIEGMLARELQSAAEKVPMQDALFVKLLELSDRKTQNIAFAYYVDGMTQEEIAEKFSLSRKTIGKRLNRFGIKARNMFLKEASL